jgi:hypothetical protein
MRRRRRQVGTSKTRGTALRYRRPRRHNGEKIVESRGVLTKKARLDSVKQDVRFTDKHLGRRIDSSELQLVLTCCLT